MWHVPEPVRFGTLATPTRTEHVARLALLKICAEHGILGSDAEREVSRYLADAGWCRLVDIMRSHSW